MKSYTDLEQSKKLLEILSSDTADMGWNVFVDETTRILPINDWDLVKNGSGNVKFYPAWSLTALLNVIKPINENTYTIRGTLDGGAIISFDEVTNVMCQEEEIIDAVFEMVVWLKEIGKI